jgi:hypothetical protein
MLGESSRLSLTAPGLSTKAEFGALSKGGAGGAVCVVCQSGGWPCTFVAVQPAGSAGGVTPSNASLNVVVGSAHEAVPASSTSVASVEGAPVLPPAATSVLPIAAPPTAERATCIAGAVTQLLLDGS